MTGFAAQEAKKWLIERLSGVSQSGVVMFSLKMMIQHGEDRLEAYTRLRADINLVWDKLDAAYGLGERLNDEVYPIFEQNSVNGGYKTTTIGMVVPSEVAQDLAETFHAMKQAKGAALQ
jgi:hypothetical protein